MPVALTKRKLDNLQTGHILEITGDRGPSFDSIQKWATNHGYEVIEALKTLDEFKIKIRKH